MDRRKGNIRNFNSKRPQRGIGMTTEELRKRKLARGEFKGPKDLRLNLDKKSRVSGSPLVDARDKLQRNRSVEQLGEKTNITLDQRRKQQRGDIHANNRFSMIDSGSIKITAKQKIAPNRSAEIEGKTIRVTTKVEQKGKLKSKQRGKPSERNPKITGTGGIRITAKAVRNVPQKKTTDSLDFPGHEVPKEVIDLNYYEYKKLKQKGFGQDSYLPSPPMRNPTPLADRLDHGPIIDPANTPTTSTRVTITNLHPSVSRQDIEELFGAIGVLKSCKTLRPGAAEVIYTTKEDAVTAYARYHNRNLDGQPMQCKLSIVQTSASIISPAAQALAPVRRQPLPVYRQSVPTLQPYLPSQRSPPPPVHPTARPVVFRVKI